MAKVFYVGKVVLKSTFSQLAEKVDKAKVRSRGPNHLGQLKDEKTIRLGKVDPEQLSKRLEQAVKLIETGKVPKAVTSAPEKVEKATLSHLKGDLTKAKKKIEALEKELEETKAKFPSADPVKDDSVKAGSGE